MLLKIDQELKDLIPPLASEDRKGLENNIKEHGCETPIAVWDGTIIDGHNRYEICVSNGIPFEVKEMHFADKEDAKLWMIKHELEWKGRKITPYIRSTLALKMENIIAEKAKANKSKAAIESNILRSTKPELENSTTPEIIADPFSKTKSILQELKSKIAEKEETKIKEIHTRNEIAKMAQVSENTIARVKKIEEKATPELKKELENGTKSINEVYKEIKKEEKQDARKEEIKQLKLELEKVPIPPSGKYDIIVIDPPWPYGTEYDPSGRRVANPYPEMSLEDIGNINIPSSDNSIIWLWTTHKFMRYSFALLDKWGYQDKSILTWVKDRIGIGAWLRSQTEFCIMAIKGHPMITLTNQSTVLNAPVREHSRKPDEFYNMVDSLCIGRKLDYFSREHRKGWEQYGNETKKF